MDFRIDKKRNLNKVDRRLSPLNPSAVNTRDSESSIKSPRSPRSPQSFHNFPLSGDATGFKKRSLGSSLQRLATEKVVAEKTLEAPFQPKFKDTASKRFSKGPVTTLKGKKVAVIGEQDQTFLQEPRKHLLFRSASLTDLPVWSMNNSVDEERKRSLTGPSKGLFQDDHALTNRTRHNASMDSDNFTEKRFQAIPIERTDRLAKFALSLTPWDVFVYTSIVETSRRTKNYLWRSNPIAIWPDWHQGVISTESLQPSVFDFKIDTNAANLSRQQVGIMSPSLAPLPMSRVGSMSPGFTLDDEFIDSDASDTSLTLNRMSSSKYKKRLTISTKYANNKKLGSPVHIGTLNSGDSNERTHLTRSHSDGDLSQYLKGFSDLKSSLQMAQIACNNEIRRILDDLQEHIDKGLEGSKSFENLQNSSNYVDSNLSVDLALPEKRISDTSSLAASKLRVAIKKDDIHSKLETIYSADSNSESHPFSSPQQEPLANIGRLMKSNSLKLAHKLDTDTSFMAALLSVIEIAQNILDLTLSSLMVPNTAQGIITQIQKYLELWMCNPEWQLQDSVVRLLIVFASIARLMEHFEEDIKTLSCMSNDKTRNPMLSTAKIVSSKPFSIGGTSRRDTFSSSIFGQELSENGEFDNDSEASLDSSPRRSLKIMPQSRRKSKFTGLVQQNLESKWNFAAFRAAVDEEQNLNILLELNPDGTASYVSPAVHKVFQYTQQDILGSKSIPFLVDPLNNILLGSTQSSPSEKSGLEISFNAKRADGRLIKIEGRGIVNKDVDGKVKSIVWIMRPVKVSRGDNSPSILPKPLYEDLNEKEGVDIIPNVDLALCNICERSVPAIHFGIHSDICLKVHKTEMDLVLLNDEIKLQKEICGEKKALLLEEISVVENEINGPSGSDSDEMQERRKYLKYLKTLCEKSVQIESILNSLWMIKVPKPEDIPNDGSFKSNIIDWICPPEEDFSLSEIVIDDGVINIGLSLYSIGKATDEFIIQKRTLMEKLVGEASEYQDCLQSEQILFVEIGIQTSTLNDNAISITHTSDKFEVKDIGGVRVKVPSLNNLKTSNTKESVLFSNYIPDNDTTEFHSGTISDASSSLESPITENPILAKNSVRKMNFLRIQTDNEDETQRRRGSLRNPRMVVGDRSLEIDSLPSPDSRKPSMLFQAANLGNFGSSSSINSSGTPVIQTPSIRDYEIIKPVSKGAFGSVFLARKKITNQYFAIKTLKKADMVAKNQVTNIKSERTILTQLDSPYVVKLFSTFQSKNHIYLVMEFLNGGDCAALLKSMRQLDEPWSRQYISEMVQGLEFLHQRDIVHRDLKPDNMLIDSNGHIKLTDFGLSKAGFIGRRAIGIGDVGGSAFRKGCGTPQSPQLTHDVPPSYQYPSLSPFRNNFVRRESIASVSSNDSLVFGSRVTEKMEDKNHKKLVGTPDYLAPESILGLGQGTSVDWWAVGVILYEFLFGIPPFNASTPSKVFENILMHRIAWYEDELELTPEARQLMEKLMCSDVESRLGSRGAGEIKATPWFNDTPWENLMSQKVFFVPTVKNIEDTDYFDGRGVQEKSTPISSDSDENLPKATSEDLKKVSPDSSNVDFGEAVYKNLPLLEKANQQTISKITQEFPDSDQWLQKRQESLQITSPLISAGFPSMKQSTSRTASATAWLQRRRDSLPANSLFGSIPVAIPSKLSSEMGSSSLRSNSFDNLSSSIENLLDFNPSHSSSIGLKNSFHSLDDSNPSLEDLNASNAQYSERNSSKDVSQSLEKDALELKKDSQAYLDSAKQSIFRKSKDAFDSKKYQEFDSEPGWLSEKPLDVLIAEANPVGSKILETILQNLNCRCIKVKNGDEAAQTLMGDIKFDIVFTDVNISIGIFDFILVNAEALVKMIKNTSNLNFQTPIVAITTSSSPITTKNEFDYVITKPVTKTSILDTLVALNLPIDDTFE